MFASSLRAAIRIETMSKFGNFKIRKFDNNLLV
jgi:hypothetical protein